MPIKGGLIDELVDDDEGVPDPIRPGMAPAGPEQGDPPAALEEPTPPRWRVRLDCPTPLAFKTLVVEAPTAEAARAAFCAANGIGGSTHEWTITPLGDGEQPAASEQKDTGPVQARPMPGWVRLKAEPGSCGSMLTGTLEAFGPPIGLNFFLKVGVRFAVPADSAHILGECILARQSDLAAALARE